VFFFWQLLGMSFFCTFSSASLAVTFCSWIENMYLIDRAFVHANCAHDTNIYLDCVLNRFYVVCEYNLSGLSIFSSIIPSLYLSTWESLKYLNVDTFNGSCLMMYYANRRVARVTVKTLDTIYLFTERIHSTCEKRVEDSNIDKICEIQYWSMSILRSKRYTEWFTVMFFETVIASQLYHTSWSCLRLRRCIHSRECSKED
jgi:hypothetical protein